MTLAVRDIAIRAGTIIMEYYEGDKGIRKKSDASPVTDADEAAERFIIAALSALSPGIPVIAEELAAAGKLPAVENRFWMVDPLDGTKEFIEKNGEFTVNIALIENGAPTIGVVYAPAIQRMFYS
ncbi:MAG: inositol monophosphatase family protein, partial [Alphaproteobacteria bacterium]